MMTPLHSHRLISVGGARRGRAHGNSGMWGKRGGEGRGGEGRGGGMEGWGGERVSEY